MPKKVENIWLKVVLIVIPMARSELTRICQDIYTTGVWPEDFLQSIIIPIKKKPNATAWITEQLAFSPMHQKS